MPSTSGTSILGPGWPDVVQHGRALPAELTSLVGRRRETTEVKRLLGDSRLVTLTGPGGVGKTRLAQRVAADVRRSFVDGVWFIDLSAVRDSASARQDVADPERLAELVAFELDAWRQSAAASVLVLKDVLGDRRTLLVLDNCEHLVEACAALAQTLLRACPQLRILATSRESLDVPGETRFAVSPLSIPDPEERPADDLAEYEAVVLFLARARAVQPDFQLTPANRTAVADLCVRTEGLPLAIELAAARLAVLSPQQIRDRLEDRFRLLRRSSRAVPERQQTLAACVDWSFELCSASERRLWARLSVFVGGSEFDEIEGICTDEDLPAADLLDALTGLVDKSILVRDNHGEVTHYRMLEALRDYGHDRLVEYGEEGLLRRKHRDWYRQLARRARDDWLSERQENWYAQLRRAHPNMRAAVDFCLAEPGGAEVALDILTALPWSYWWGRGLFTEGRRWLDLALKQTSGASCERTHAVLLDSRLAFAQGDADAGTRLLEQGDELAQQLDEPSPQAHAAYARGVGALYSGDLKTALHLLSQARMLMARVVGPDPDLQLHVLLHLSITAGLSGDHELADSCREQIVELTRGGHGFRQLLWAYALVDWSQGRLDDVVEHEREYLRIRLEHRGDTGSGSAVSMEVLAWVAARRQQHRHAAQLLGAADALFTASGSSIDAYHHLAPFHRECRERVQQAIGKVAFASAFDRGRGLTYQQALHLALGEQPPDARGRRSGRLGPSPLTRREREIAQLVADGLRNKEIAAALVISQRTAEAHVEHILSKLGFTSRSQIAAWIAQQSSEGPN
jgi:predicted ATPase/DNA-binding NarL/FixJ family response regulator